MPAHPFLTLTNPSFPMQKLYLCLGFILILLACHSPVQAQLQASQWYLQNGYFLDFQTSPPTLINRPSTSGVFSISTTMSNRNGDLQFYGIPSWVYDRAGNIMPGSTPTLTGPVGPNGSGRILGQCMAVETNLLNRYIYVVGDGVPDVMDESWRIRTAPINMDLRGTLGDIGPAIRELVPTEELSAFAGGYSCEADKYWLVTVYREFPTAERSIFYKSRS